MINNNIKSCSFFGHRNIEITEELKIKLKQIIEELIIKNNVVTFLFGSKSNFNSLCHLIVTELKHKYINIKRISYTCKSEKCLMENEREILEKIYFDINKEKVCLQGFEGEVEHKTKNTSGRASYIERNYAMINDSDYCILFYNEKYKPDFKKYSKSSIGYYQPRSGTSLAYNYAKQKNKNIINVYE